MASNILLDVNRIRTLVAEHDPTSLPALDAVLAAAAKASALALKKARREAAMDERDRLLRAAAARLLPGARPTPAGKALHRAIEAYRRRRWLDDAGRTSVPPELSGTTEELIWLAMKIAKVPTGERQIIDVAADKRVKKSTGCRR